MLNLKNKHIVEINYWDLNSQEGYLIITNTSKVKEAEKILYENADYNPIYFRSTESLQNPSLKGLVRNSTGLQVDFTYAYKE